MSVTKIFNLGRIQQMQQKQHSSLFTRPTVVATLKTQNLVQLSKWMETHTHTHVPKVFITYIMRISRENRAGLYS